MNKHILKYGLALSALALVVGCEVNDYNEDQLDGYTPGFEITDAQELQYTLTKADYKAIATNKTNIAKANLAGLTDELKALEKSQAFSSKLTAADYVPAFLASKYDYYLTHGSRVVVTHNQRQEELPATVQGVLAAQDYVLTAADYESVWGNAETDYLTPATEKKLRGIIAGSHADAKEGDFVIAEYQYSASEPSTGGDGPVEEKVTLKDILGDKGVVGDEYTIEAQVVGNDRFQCVVSDGTADILVYFSKEAPVKKPADLKNGDVCKLTSVLGEHNGKRQFKDPVAFEISKAGQAVKYPQAEVVSGEQLQGMSGLTTLKYVQLTGTMDAARNNLLFKGLPEGAVYKAARLLSAEVKWDPYFGQDLTVEGYLLSFSVDFNSVDVIVTKINGEQIAPKTLAFTRAAADLTKRYVVFKYDGKMWGEAPKTLVVNPEDFDQMGIPSRCFSSSVRPDNYLPTFLKLKAPYAQEEDAYTVAYKFDEGEQMVMKADEFVMTANAWVKTTTPVKVMESPFKKVNKAWMYDPDVTLVLQPGKGVEASKEFFTTCVKWVAANKGDQFLGAKFDTEEWYSGATYYQNSFTWTPGLVIGKNWQERGLYTEEELKPYLDFNSADYGKKKAACQAFFNTMEQHAAEVLKAALETHYADAKTIPGTDVYYTVRVKIHISMAVTPDSEVTHEFKFKLVDNGKFEYVEKSFKHLSDKYDLMSDAFLEAYY